MWGRGGVGVGCWGAVGIRPQKQVDWERAEVAEEEEKVEKWEEGKRSKGVICLWLFCYFKIKEIFVSL